MTKHAHDAKRCGVLIIVQKYSLPFDQRLWLESAALIRAGYRVSVICPKRPGDAKREVVGGVRMYRYEPPPAANSFTSYALNSAYCWLRAALLSVLVVLRDHISIIQASGPPDTYWALAVPYRFFGRRFVYDQRDLSPELFCARFGPPVRPSARLLHRLLAWLERRSCRTADHVIVRNESFRRIAIDRGGVADAQITVVRSAPDTTQMRPSDERPELREGRQHLLVYRGPMEARDGVDLVLRVLYILIHRLGRKDIHAALLGFGDAYEDLVVLCRAFDLDDYVTFTGRAGADLMSQYLSTADIAICPDLASPANDELTMEYLSFALPVVSYDLLETRLTGGDAVEYVTPGPVAAPATVNRFAEAVSQLLDNPARRAYLSLEGRRRAETVLDWGPQRAAYVGVFDGLSDPDPDRLSQSATPRKVRVGGAAC